MKIKREDFKRALEIVKPGLAAKEVIEQTTSFAFVKGHVITYDDEISINHPIEGWDITGAVKAEELYKFLTKVKTDEIDVSTGGTTIKDDDGNDAAATQIIFKSGRSKVGLIMKEKVVIPIEKEIKEQGKWKKIPETFIKSFGLAAETCSLDMAHPKLTCVHVNKKGFVESSDGYRMSRYDIGEAIPVPTCLIPAGSAKKIRNLKPVKMASGNGWVHFKTEEGSVISCRTFNEKFVDTSKMQDVGKKVFTINMPEELLEVMDRAEVFTNEDMEITIKKKELIVQSQSASGWFEETLKIDYKGGQFEFRVTPYLLTDILKRTLECNIHKDRLRFKGENWVYITTLKEAKVIKK